MGRRKDQTKETDERTNEPAIKSTRYDRRLLFDAEEIYYAFEWLKREYAESHAHPRLCKNCDLVQDELCSGYSALSCDTHNSAEFARLMKHWIDVELPKLDPRQRFDEILRALRAIDEGKVPAKIGSEYTELVRALAAKTPVEIWAEIRQKLRDIDDEDKRQAAAKNR